MRADDLVEHGVLGGAGGRCPRVRVQRELEKRLGARVDLVTKGSVRRDARAEILREAIRAAYEAGGFTFTRTVLPARTRSGSGRNKPSQAIQYFWL